MEEILLRKLIEKQYFKVSTEIDAVVRGRGIDGLAMHKFAESYTVSNMGISRKTGKLMMDLHALRDGHTARIDADAIVGIDGMTPERFAENYMIAPDGTDIKVVGKRRGRRPKGWTPDMENNG